MQSTVNQRIKTRLTFPNPRRVTYLCSGNSPTNDLVTEILPYSALFCFLAKWKNKAFQLILNRLRFIYPILFSFAWEEIIHVARHSYATSVCLANGVSLDNVAKMLGHSDTKMTQHYAKVLDSSIMRDMAGVEQCFANSLNRVKSPI